MGAPIKFKATLTGGQKLKAELKKYQELYPAAMNRAVFREGYSVFNKSQVLTPVDTNNLRGTATVQATEDNADGTFVITYPTEYAVYVHEAPAGTNFHAPGTQSKFLEQPLRENINGMAKRMADYVKSQVKAG